MREDLLQYIWKFQLFNKGDLQTVDGQAIQVIHSGMHNHNQGPDFLEARIRMGKQEWFGHVEIHVRSSDWDQHQHSNDAHYQNVILHVVLHHDKEIEDVHGNKLLTLELKDRIPGLLLNNYQRLLNQSQFIPCENQLPELSEITLLNFTERLVAERLMKKAEVAIAFLKENGGHWEETFWWMIAANFGSKVNGEAFLQLAKSLSVNILGKHRNNPMAIEALLMGQCGLLQGNFNDDYPRQLKQEYLFYQKKLGLKPIQIPLKYSQMRPVNFPTIRLAQLATLICKSSHLFSKIKGHTQASELYQFFEITASSYWDTHYQFDASTIFRKKSLGKTMKDNILINTIAPILFAYGMYHQQENYKEKAIELLGQVPAEANRITKNFVTLGFKNTSALDSQFLLQLKNEYCDQKLCLSCVIGNKILQE